VQRATTRLGDRGMEICHTPQNLAEFWNVATRPSGRNGLGLSIASIGLKKGPKPSPFRGPTFDGLIGGDAAKTLHPTLQILRRRVGPN